MILLIAVTSLLVALCHAQTCDDVDSAICQDMYAIDPSICSKACYSVALCPRFCGKCPLKCYSCHEVDSPDLCNTTMQCPSGDHFCIETQSFNDEFKDVYKLGCALNSVCTTHFGPAFGRRDSSLSKRSGLQGSCCTTDLCNGRIQTATTSPPQTQKATTMPKITFLASSPPATQKPTIMPKTTFLASSPPATQKPTIMPKTTFLASSPPATQKPTVMPTTAIDASSPPATKQPTVMPTSAIDASSPPATKQPTIMPTTMQSSVSVFPDIPRDLRDILSSAQENTTMTSVPAVTSDLCDDIDGDICTRLETHFPSMCTIDCIANEVCPRKCGKCMGCYKCDHVTNPETCTDQTICGRGEQCFAVETISANFEQGFKLGCMDERLCSTFGHAAPGIFGKRQGFELSLHGACCTGEFCNHHALFPTSTAPTTPSTTSTTSTTTVPTTSQTGCHAHYSSCPSGWYRHQQSCFAIGTPEMTWNDARVQCRKNCGELADFDSSTDLHSVALTLGRHISGLSNVGNDGVHVWVAGKLSHSVWQWTTTGHVASTTLQHNNHYRYDYCGFITIVPSSSHSTGTASSYLHPQACTVRYLPLCEIKNVN